ncbi:cation transporter [Candidatus Saccharibacteria bacterium]|nr:cation transporter [Candidatus Saccharibacteria bacterium]
MKKRRADQNILIAFGLNLVFFCAEVVGGILTGSITIMSDAVHDLGDVLSMAVSYVLERKSRKSLDEKHTYGYVRYSVMGSVFTTVVLVVGSVMILHEAVGRFFEPTEVQSGWMILMAVVGLVVHGVATVVTRGEGSLNQRAVNLHMLEDFLGWIVVLLGAILIKLTGANWIDPLMSIGVAGFILVMAVKNFRSIVDLFLEKTPNDVSVKKMVAEAGKVAGVIDVHHVHVRSIDGYHNLATLHVVVKEYDPEVKRAVKAALKKCGVEHATIDMELESEACEEEVCEVEFGHHHGHHH